MKNVWQLQEAKNKLSEVLREAREHGPQTITLRGEEEAVVISADEYRKLKDVNKPKKRTLLEALRACPVKDIDFEKGRNRDLPGPAIEF